MPTGIYNHKPHSSATIEKIRQSHLGDRNPMFGTVSPFRNKHPSNLVRKRISEFAKKRIGVLNPNWKGGITLPNLHGDPRYKIWRREVLKRFDHKCSLCGSKKGIVSDHPLPVALFPEFAFDPINGRALCKKCDREQDTYGGRVHRLTRENFITVEDEKIINQHNNDIY